MSDTNRRDGGERKVKKKHRTGRSHSVVPENQVGEQDRESPRTPRKQPTRHRPPPLIDAPPRPKR